MENGLIYSVFATLVTLALGTGLGFLSVRAVVKTMNPYFSYSFPRHIVLIYLAILLIVQFILISYFIRIKLLTMRIIRITI